MKSNIKEGLVHSFDDKMENSTFVNVLVAMVKEKKLTLPEAEYLESLAKEVAYYFIDKDLAKY